MTEPVDLTAQLATLRERGASRRAPVRWQLIEALARRAASREGAARRVLDDRLTTLLKACEAELAEAPQSTEAEPAAEAPSPLAELLALLGHAQPPTRPPAPAPVASKSAKSPAPVVPAPSAPAELKAVQLFQRTWSRLSAEQRLAQSRASLPDNAGPLNSQHLLHRTLSLMRELSPAYFEHFIDHVDALLWLEQANTPPARAEPERKPARSKASG